MVGAAESGIPRQSPPPPPKKKGRATAPSPSTTPAPTGFMAPDTRNYPVTLKWDRITLSCLVYPEVEYRIYKRIGNISIDVIMFRYDSIPLLLALVS